MMLYDAGRSWSGGGHAEIPNTSQSEIDLGKQGTNRNMVSCSTACPVYIKLFICLQ